MGFPFSTGSLLSLSLLLSIVHSQNVPCTTPGRRSGLCVSIERCRNIHNIVTSPNVPSKKLTNYINRAACVLPGIERSVCCEPQEVVPSSATRESLLPLECGKTISDRVSHGNATRVFAYPWMAILRYDDMKGKIIDGCGGTLINERYVLTAAHCIKDKNWKLHSVILGEHTKGQEQDCEVFQLGSVEDRDCAGPVEEFSIESYESHENYNRPKYHNDIGLIRLNRNVIMKNHIQPICLPITADLQKQNFNKYILTGWGTTENQTTSDVLLEAYLPRVDNEDCQQSWQRSRLNIQLSSKHMCAGGKDLADACKGDSGGPLGTFANYRGTRFVQYGIAVAGVASCGQVSIPGVYCRVVDYMDWILEKMRPSN